MQIMYCDTFLIFDPWPLKARFQPEKLAFLQLLRLHVRWIQSELFHFYIPQRLGVWVGKWNPIDDAMEQKEVKAVWSTKRVNTFPDSSFLHILPGGKKVDGKTTPKSLRMFPYKDENGKIDLPHLRNAIARIPQSNRIDAATKSKLQTKARNILKKQSKEKGLQ